MAKMSGKVTDLPTKCRFAVLEVSDDDDEDEFETVRKDGSTAKTTSETTGAKKKRNRKKKHRSRGHQGGEAATESPTTTTAVSETLNPPVEEEQEWQQWQSKDEQIVLMQFQKDLKAALQASKLESLNQCLDTNQSTAKQKKKEKPVSMSLEEFVSGNIQTAQETSHPQTNGVTCNAGNISSLDDFLDYEDEAEPEQQKEQKSKPKRRKKSKSESESKKQESEAKKIVMTGTTEDFIKAEMFHIQEKLEQKDEAVTDLHKTVEQQQQLIDELQKELAQVKKRNKQLCYILAQGEMKEKSELLTQIEELNEVREQVVQLHGELEQERSKSSSL